MRYTEKRFTVASGVPNVKPCNEGEHPFADAKGKCVRCGERIRPDPFAEKPQHDLDAMKNGRTPAA